MKRHFGLDLARLISAYLVVFGHLAYGATFAVDAVYQQWTLRGETLPLLDKDAQSAWVVDYFMLVNWGTAGAVIGVGLFFLISGWVVPPMLEKYSTSQFLKNRVLRIFPILIFSVLVAAAIQWAFGGQNALQGWAVVSSMFLLNDFTGYPVTLGVIWTLVIEVEFYILLAFLGRLNQKKIIITVIAIGISTVVLYVLLLAGLKETSPDLMQVLKALIHNLSLIILLFSSASLYLAVQQKSRSKVTRFLPLVFCIIAFNVVQIFCREVLDIQFIQNINLATQLIIYTLFLLFLFLPRKLNTTVFGRMISEASNMTYSIYLLHISIGVFLLSVLRHHISNQYLLLGIVFLIISVISYGSYYLIEKRLKYKSSGIPSN